MKRQNPLFAPFGVVLTVLLLAVLGLSIWSSGGEVFSPGPLSAKTRAAVTWQGYESHAEFESQCSLCHAPLETTQDQLCLKCHENIGEQITSQEGTHSLIEEVNNCARCHLEHQGKDFNPTYSAFHLFEHSKTSFSLVRHSLGYDASPMQCQTCHANETDFTVSNSACGNCHALEDREFMLNHILEFSQDCLICHDGADRMTMLDHQSLRFPLEGKHAEVGCVECHNLKSTAARPGTGEARQATRLRVALQTGGVDSAPDPFENTPTACQQCHNEPEVHKGYFTGQCDECHTSEGWKQATLGGSPFDHAADTGFSLARHSLDYESQPMICSDCHQEDLDNFDQQSCIACHASGEPRAAFMLAHREQFGDGCLECHDGADRMSDFEHAQFFPLAGRHAEIECDGCHQAKKFAGTPSECVQCHTEPAIHAGVFGVQCQYCHAADSWTPAQLRIHTFPLDHGGQGEIACQVCHPANYVEYTCYGCHDHQAEQVAASHQQAGIALEDLANCIHCHTDGKIEAGN